MDGAGHDQFIPDGMDETMGFSTSPGDEDNQMGNGHSDFSQQRQTAGGGHGIADSADALNETQKLQLAERANEIYRQQLKYMQDHLASLRSLIQDKENIIENLMLRYDLGIITQDSSRQNGNLGADEIEQNELRRKAEALAQRTILENFELREMVNELRDENFHLRNEIYELQDKINRQVLSINKLEKKLEAQDQLQALRSPPRRSLQWHERVTNINIEDILPVKDESVSNEAMKFSVNELFRLCSAEHVPDDLQRMIITYDVGFLFLFMLFWLHCSETISWGNV